MMRKVQCEATAPLRRQLHEMTFEEFVNGIPSPYDKTSLRWRLAYMALRFLRMPLLSPTIAVYHLLSARPKLVTRVFDGVRDASPNGKVTFATYERRWFNVMVAFFGGEIVGLVAFQQTYVPRERRRNGFGMEIVIAALQVDRKPLLKPAGFTPDGYRVRVRAHKEIVRRALARGDTVPAHILDKYPDIKVRPS